MTDEIVPVRIDSKLSELIQRETAKIFEAIEAGDFAKIDNRIY